MSWNSLTSRHCLSETASRSRIPASDSSQTARLISDTVFAFSLDDIFRHNST